MYSELQRSNSTKQRKSYFIFKNRLIVKYNFPNVVDNYDSSIAQHRLDKLFSDIISIKDNYCIYTRIRSKDIPNYIHVP